MPVEYGRESNYAKEMRRHEAFNGEFGPAGRPYERREFPKMLFKATRVTGQGITISENTTVGNPHEQRNMESRGFHATQELAVAAIEHEQLVHGTLAAEREYAIQHGHHSERAVGEIRSAEAEHGARHLPDVAEKPKRKYQRKTQPVT